jgi:transcriptional regulator with XRE-family HTH domain
MTITRPRGVTPFGALLRQWRTSRGLSQLALSTTAGTTSRHVSLLETGRSRPTESMVLRLGTALDISLRDRNRLLEAAFGEDPLAAPRYEQARAAVDQLLAAHEPYPAIVVERGGQVISANGGAARLFGGDLSGENLMDWMFRRGDPGELIANWPDVARSMVDRLRNDLARAPHDERLRAALEAAEAVVTDLGVGEPVGEQLVVCPWFIVEGREIRTMVIAARFDNAVDVTLDELRIELVYPLDEAAEEFFRAVD